MKKLAILACILLASSLSAAEPKAPAKLGIAKEGQLARLVIPVEKGQIVNYKATATEDELGVYELVSRKETEVSLLLQGNKEGVYYIAFKFKGDEDIVFTQITVGKSVPDDTKPKPPPVPDDTKPKPLPTGGKLKLYLITESADKNPAYARIFGSKAFDDYWKSKGYGEKVVADPQTKDPATDTTPVKLKPYIDRAKGLSDQLYLVDISTGELIYEGNAPQSEADFLTLLKKLAGG